jgi:hypothetical protein
MLRLGAGYLFDRDFMEIYEHEGPAYIKKDIFWDKYQIGIPQFKYDVMYLYGLLQSATRKYTNPYIVHHRQDKDGLSVWIKFEKAYANGGSKTMKSEELEEQVFTRYDPKKYNGMADYIDQFQTWIEELDALGTRNYGDADKKRTLLRNLKTHHKLLSLIQICHDDLLKDFEETANYLRENGTSLDRTMKQLENTPSRMLTTVREEEMTPSDTEPSVDDCMKVVQALAQETSIVQAFNALKSPMVRGSLNIPTEIWLKLEPQLKQRISDIKDKIRKKMAQESPREKAPMPSQYPSPAQKVNAIIS